MKFIDDYDKIGIAQLDNRILYLSNFDVSNKWLYFVQEAMKRGELPLKYSCNNLERRLEEYNYLCNNGYLNSIERRYCQEYLTPTNKVRTYYTELTRVARIRCCCLLTNQDDYILLHLNPKDREILLELIYPDITADGVRGKLFTEDNKTYFQLGDIGYRTIYHCEIVSTSEYTLSKEQTDEFCELYRIYRYDFPEQHTMKVHTVKLLDIAVDNSFCLEKVDIHNPQLPY